MIRRYIECFILLKNGVNTELLKVSCKIKHYKTLFMSYKCRTKFAIICNRKNLTKHERAHTMKIEKAKGILIPQEAPVERITAFP